MDTAPVQGKFKFQGLSPFEVHESRQQFGANIIAPPERDPWWIMYAEKFDDPIIRILIIAAIIATIKGFIRGDHFEGIAIIFTIFLATFLAFLNEYKAHSEFDLLLKAKDDVNVKVVRSGDVVSLPRGDLVVGDIIFVETGDEIPADAEPLETVSLMVNESRLTGESLPIMKFTPDTIPEGCLNDEFFPLTKIFRGTMVVEGHGIAKITAVGDKTEAGTAAKSAAEDFREVTPLTHQLEKLGKVISFFGFSGGVLIFVTLVGRGIVSGELQASFQQSLVGIVLAIGIFVATLKIWLPLIYEALEHLGFEITSEDLFGGSHLQDWAKFITWGINVSVTLLAIGYVSGVLSLSPNEWFSGEVGTVILKYFMVVVAVIVVAVPEGLSMAVALCLAYGMRKMMAANNLVRRLHASETIGAATVICSDKTGTLTKNEMVVETASFPGYREDSAAFWKTREGKLVCEAIAANSTAHLCRKKGPKPSPIGNMTEGALLTWMNEANLDYLPIRDNFSITRQWTFTADRKFMATMGESPFTKGDILYIKGAPETVLDKCDKILTVNGIKPLTDERETIENLLEEFQLRGMRTLGFAFLEHPAEHCSAEESQCVCRSGGNAKEDDLDRLSCRLVWMGCVAIADPIREEVKESIELCLKAGVQVKMVTGDNPKTAMEVAKKIGLWTASDDFHAHLCGGEFMKLTEAQALERLKKVKVISRAKPLDKLRLVSLLKQDGHVVAVTGDGANDAPALNCANVGLSMGKTGTDIAKEASDIVLLDDSFVSITTAIMWGRSLYLNIQRFLVFQLTINLTALGLTLLGPLLGFPVPLTVLQMLWINLIMDTFAALALATEPPSPALMDRPPRNNEEFIITPEMSRSIVTFGIFSIVLFLGMLFYFGRTGNFSDYHLSFFFTTFVLFQFWNLFNVRGFGLPGSSLSNLTSNPWFIVVAATIFLGQFLMVQFGGAVFRTVPLSFQDWLLIVVGTSPVLFIREGILFFQKDDSWTRDEPLREND